MPVTHGSATERDAPAGFESDRPVQSACGGRDAALDDLEAASVARAAANGSPSLSPSAREALRGLIQSHPFRTVLMRHEEAVMRVAALLPQISRALEALAGISHDPGGESGARQQASHGRPASLAPGGEASQDLREPGQSGAILKQFLEFVAFSTPEMKRLVAGER